MEAAPAHQKPLALGTKPTRSMAQMYHQLGELFSHLLKEKPRGGLKRVKNSTDTDILGAKIASSRIHCIREGRKGTADVSAAHGFPISVNMGKKAQ